MDKNKKLISIYLCIGAACGLIAIATQKSPKEVESIEATTIAIDSTYDNFSAKAKAYQAELLPIKDHLDKTMGMVIGQNAAAMRGHRPESLLSNWTSDVLLEAANEVSDSPVDISIMNMGGLRCEIPQGDIQLRKVFELMPFDNELVLLAITGQDVIDLCNCFAEVGGEGVGGVRFIIEDGKAKHILVGGKKVESNKTYKIATSNYLAEGNDNMIPLTRRTEYVATGILLRNIFHQAILKATEKGETIAPKLDGRIVRRG